MVINESEIRNIYKVEISMTPSSENVKAPYFWSLHKLEPNSGKWTLEQAGWEKSRLDAWIEADKFYARYK